MKIQINPVLLLVKETELETQVMNETACEFCSICVPHHQILHLPTGSTFKKSTVFEQTILLNSEGPQNLETLFPHTTLKMDFVVETKSVVQHVVVSVPLIRGS
jgi:hypothetical protein